MKCQCSTATQFICDMKSACHCGTGGQFTVKGSLCKQFTNVYESPSKEEVHYMSLWHSWIVYCDRKSMKCYYGTVGLFTVTESPRKSRASSCWYGRIRLL